MTSATSRSDEEDPPVSTANFQQLIDHLLDAGYLNLIGNLMSLLDVVINERHWTSLMIDATSKVSLASKICRELRGLTNHV